MRPSIAGVFIANALIFGYLAASEGPTSLRPAFITISAMCVLLTVQSHEIWRLRRGR